jgi:rhamnosyl/mannosyltransferase
VHLVGEVSDAGLASHLAAASLFVLPSTNRAEAFGISLLEAQAAELPVIATDVGTGTTEAILPDQSGRLIPPNDTQALVAAISEVLTDSDRREAMGKAGRQHVELHNSLDALSQRLGPVYEGLRQRPATGAESPTRH